MKTFYEFLNEVKLTTDFIYYHGCSKSELGEKIIADGFLRPGNEDVKRGGKLTPVIGMTYATPNLREAIVYTIGGVFLGTNFPYKEESRYGYLFEIDNLSFTDVIPDEDYVGQIIYWLNRYKKGDRQYVDFLEDRSWQKLHEWSDSKMDNYIRICKDILTPLQYQKCIRYDDYADFAVAGKKLNKYLDDYWKGEIINLGVPVGNKGNLKFNKIWKFDKENCSKLDKTGKNFFELAERIK